MRPYVNAGTSTSTIFAPASSSASNAASTRSTTSGSAPAGRSVIRPTRSPSTPSSSTERRSGAGRGIDVESPGSWPPITSRARAASATVVANGPIWSRLEANATSPMRLTTPYVGFTPTTPHSAAGWRIDPPVSLPKPSGGEAGGDRGGTPAARAAGHPASCRAGCGSARTPSSPCSNPSRTRRGWSCRRSPPRRPAAG